MPTAEDTSTGLAAAVIVAHPDDETLWCGGFVLSHPQWSWTVLSLCRASDPDRAPKFARACKCLGARSLICDLDDSPNLDPVEPVRDIDRPILEHLGLTEWHIILTHGANGEYGHPRHQQVHESVARLVDARALPCRALWTFAYAVAADGTCRPLPDADAVFPVGPELLEEKRQIVRDIYGYAPDSFEGRACAATEAFHHRRLPQQEDSR